METISSMVIFLALPAAVTLTTFPLGFEDVPFKLLRQPIAPPDSNRMTTTQTITWGGTQDLRHDKAHYKKR